MGTERMTEKELLQMTREAKPCTDVVVLPSGQVIFKGRAQLDVMEQSIIVSPDNVLTAAHAISVAAVGAARALRAKDNGL